MFTGRSVLSGMPALLLMDDQLGSGCGPHRALSQTRLYRGESGPTPLRARGATVRVARAATLQRPLFAVRFAVELRLDAPRFAAELRFAGELAAPPELRSFCSRSRSRSTALFIFSRSRRASRRSLATSLRRSLPPVRTLARIARSSFSAASSAVLVRAIARPFCSKRARAAAVIRVPAAGFLAAALREDDALRVVVFRALAFVIVGIDAPCLGTTGRSVAELLTIRRARRDGGKRQDREHGL